MPKSAKVTALYGASLPLLFPPTAPQPCFIFHSSHCHLCLPVRLFMVCPPTPYRNISFTGAGIALWTEQRAPGDLQELSGQLRDHTQ